MRALLAALVLSLVGVTASCPTFAHDKPIKGPNGGQLIHVDDAHYELVAKDNALTLFVSDNDTKPRATVDGTKATAAVLADGKTTTVELKPATADTLKGTGTFVAKPGLRVVVSIQETSRKPAQIRFTPAE
jgi:hypothetical protein